jgi:general secretion pathway protein N
VCCAIAGGASVAAFEADEGNSTWQQRSGNPLWAIRFDSLSATRDRPIFSVSRRPPPPIVPPVVVAAPPPPPLKEIEPEQLRLTLLGTVVAGDGGIAICLNQGTGETVRVRMGEDFEGWTLRSVRKREVAFEKAELRALLGLPSPDDPQPSAPAPRSEQAAPMARRQLPPEKPLNPATAPPWGALLKR